MTTFYHLSTVAREFDVSRSTLHNWWKRGLIHASGLADGRMPLFSAEDKERMATIVTARRDACRVLRGTDQ